MQRLSIISSWTQGLFRRKLPLSKPAAGSLASSRNFNIVSTLISAEEYEDGGRRLQLDRRHQRAQTKKTQFARKANVRKAH